MTRRAASRVRSGCVSIDQTRLLDPAPPLVQFRPLRVLSATALFAFLCACSQPAEESAARSEQPPTIAADMVLRGGKVATMDAALGEAQAIALRGHEIAAVGSNEEINAYIGAETEVVELNGRLVIPGFIEGHGHYMSLGRSKQILDLNNVHNWDEIVNMVAVAVDQAQPGEWIFGRGWHQDKWDSVPQDAVDGVPRNDSLNAVAPDNPVLLGHASGHAAFANDAALSRPVSAKTPPIRRAAPSCAPRKAKPPDCCGKPRNVWSAPR